MRSSKSRSRSKANRPRTLGNIINRVFDSSGPEGKVRGTPQQIIEKFQQLARDAQLSNDRVAAENFLQHAEHYTRLLGEAQREMMAEQEARQQQGGGQGYANQGGGQNNNQSNNQNNNQNGGQNGNQNGGQRNDRDGYRDRNENFRDRDRDRSDREAPRAERQDYRDQPDDYTAPVQVIDLGGRDEDAGLVETPEARLRNRPQGDGQQPSRHDGDRRDRNQNRPPRNDRSDRPEGERRDRADDRRPQPSAAPQVVPIAVAAPAAAPAVPVAPTPVSEASAAAPKPRREKSAGNPVADLIGEMTAAAPALAEKPKTRAPRKPKPAAEPAAE
jgi:hypothetical protein